VLVAAHRVKNLLTPDEAIRMPGATADLVTIDDLTVGREVNQPGWSWSTDMRPLVGGEWCESHHIGMVVSGHEGFRLRDGTTFEIGPDDVFDIPPGHDAWTIGDEPAVMIEWSGFRTWVGTAGSFGDRILATLMFTDVVDSTATVSRIGDRAWRELLTRHLAAAREILAEHRGRLIDTTGDGLFAIFDGPGHALRCASAIRSVARREGIGIRAGVHVGEVEVVGTGLRGLAVHEAARVMGQAAPDEILVSAPTRAVAVASGLRFEERGLHELKGLEGPRALFAYLDA